jgi:hypothetical protein
MNDRVPATTSAHATHDLDRVAALAARPADLDERLEVAAREQVAACTACADVLADLVLLQTTLPDTATPARPRDFALTPTDAARLRSGGWHRVLGFVGSARDSFTRPLAVGLTSLGLVGLLVATVPSFIGGSGGAAALAPVERTSAGSDIAGEAGQPAGAAPAASAAPSASVAAASLAAPVPAPVAGAVASEAPSIGAQARGSNATDRYATSTEPQELAASGETVFAGGNPDELQATTGGRDTTGDGGLLSIRDDGSGLSVLFVVAGAMLIAGLGLFLLRWTSRRLL